nr:MAG TPA_asm: hypothetical protein [Caudoviricetes sp.]
MCHFPHIARRVRRTHINQNIGTPPCKPERLPYGSGLPPRGARC